MDVKKYDIIRNKINKMDFEGKYKQLSDWLFVFSFFGNVGSIFFAFFLMYPIFYNSLGYYITNNDYLITLSFLFSLVILFMFELIKRIVLKNFSFDFVNLKYKLKSFSVVSWLMVSLSLITLSFYLSINGAMKLADNKNIYEETLNQNVSQKSDSLNFIFNGRISQLELQIEKIENDNVNLRESRNNLPDNHISNRNLYLNQIKYNDEQIIQYRNRIDLLNKQFEDEKSKLYNSIDVDVEKYISDNRTSIYIFILISSLIELLIIGGVYFRTYYQLTVFKMNNNLEKIFKKRDDYLVLLSYIYKNGQKKSGDTVIGVSKLKETLKEYNIENVNKLTNTFYVDLEYNNIIKTQGKRKYFMVNYDEAVEKINELDETIDILNKLKK